MQSARSNFRFLNREGRWLGFHSSGLEVTPQGALQLLSAPRLLGESDLTSATDISAPSGIAVDDSGRVFYSVPVENRIVTVGGCDSAQTQLPCLTEGTGQGTLCMPRGLLILQNPERLVVADTGNDRLLFFDLLDFNLRDVWGQQGLGAWPISADDPNEFNYPWTVAADGGSQNIYVLDTGNRRVLKFARTGDAYTDFLDGVRNSGLVQYPTALAVSGSGAKTHVFVFDSKAKAIFVFDASGASILDAHCAPAAIRWPGMGGVIAMAASETALYVGDNERQRILSFALTDGFPFSGEAAGFHRYVTALAIDSERGKLLVQTGDGTQPLSLESTGAYLNSGVLWSDAISGGATPVVWNRLEASITNAAGSHVEFYYAVSEQKQPPPVDTASDDPFRDDQWRPLLKDVEDFLLIDDKGLSLRGPYLFVGARFSSDRTGTPRLTQMRADFDIESYTRYLPAIYREPEDHAAFLRRLVSLFQGLFEDIEEEVDSLERYFDPLAAPAEGLGWLATWLNVDMDQGEPLPHKRSSIAQAFRRYQWRGTIEGLRLALLEDAGIHAIVSEPISASTFWAMPPPADCSGSAAVAGPQLGMGTHLPSMEPGGAVLGSTAEINHSYLITDAQFGEPLFTAAAWQFVVEVYRSEVNTDERLRLLKEIIEREKPAHTMYRLEFIESKMRAGFQARVGVDTIISGTSGPTGLGLDGRAGLRLGGPSPLRVGTSRLGEDLKILS